MLAKVDRFAMSVGLELRAPLLDQGVVGLMRVLPVTAKIAGGRGKQVLRRRVPRPCEAWRDSHPARGSVRNRVTRLLPLSLRVRLREILGLR